eukprot:590195-Prymnesium_polylepis.1
MSSWTSHLAEGASKLDGHFQRLIAIGMNEPELKTNAAAHAYHVQDLNVSPSLPMLADSSVDAVFCSVSVDCALPGLEPWLSDSPFPSLSGSLCGRPVSAARGVCRDPSRAATRRARRLHVVQPDVPNQGDPRVARRQRARAAVDLWIVLSL